MPLQNRGQKKLNSPRHVAMVQAIAIPSLSFSNNILRIFIEIRDYPMHRFVLWLARFCQPHLNHTTCTGVHSMCHTANIKQCAKYYVQH